MFTYTYMLDFSTKVDFDGERFRYFMFLVGIQCVINAVFAKSGKRNNGRNSHYSLHPSPSLPPSLPLSLSSQPA